MVTAGRSAKHKANTDDEIIGVHTGSRLQPPMFSLPKQFSYATIDASFTKDRQRIFRVCVDTGNPITLIDRKTLELYGAGTVPVITSPIRIQGVGNKITKVTEAARFTLHLDHGNMLKVNAFVINDLKAGLLLGINTLTPANAIIDLKHRQLRVADQAAVPLFVSNDKASSRRKCVVVASKRVKMEPGQMTEIPIRPLPLNPAQDALFIPCHPTALSQLINLGDESIQACNYTPDVVEIPAGATLGHLDTAWNDAHEIDPSNWVYACNFGDAVDAMNEGRVRAVAPNENSALSLHNGPFNTSIHGNAEVVAKFSSLIQKYGSLYNDDGKTARLPEEDWLEIPLVNDWRTAGAKLNHKVYPVGPKDKELIDETHDKLHVQGRMSWTTKPTPFGFPVFVVWRNVNGQRKGRVVVDIRGLNRITMTDAYPMPLQSDITAAVAGCRFISTVDMASFFYQWLVKRSDRHKLTVVSHRGQEHFNVAAMGFKNSPPYVQRQIERILRKQGCWKFARAFVDDVVIFSKSLEEHLEHLDCVFAAFDEMNLTLSGKKCFLGFPSIELLGQHVNRLGVSTSQQKLEAIAKLKFPTHVKELEHYLGLTGWLRNYIPYYAQLAEPLQRAKTEKLKKAPHGKQSRAHFTSSTQVEDSPLLLDAFNALQKEFAKPSLLHHYDKTRPVYIHLDASKERGFGVMVAHLEGDAVTGDPPRRKTQPILFLSKSLSSAERKYWPTELEIACLVWTIRRIRWMVEACEKPVVALTDHAAVTDIARQTSLKSTSVDKLNNRHVRASQYLNQFPNLQVLYKPGREHVVPDALSRLQAPDDVTKPEDDVLEELLLANAVTQIHIDPAFKEQLLLAYDSDKHLCRVKAMLKNAEPGSTSFSVDDEQLLWMEDRLCIPRALEGDIFEAAHDSQFHVGFNRTYDRINEQYFIRKLAARLRKYLEHCPQCQLLSTKRHAPYGQLHPIQSPPLPFHTITIDFVVALPLSSEYNSLMSVTCKFTKKVLLIPGRDDYTADAWAHRLLDELLRADWGLPTRIISDRDPKFTSMMWKTMFERLETKLLLSTAYHPQTDGQSERTNQTVEIALRYYLAKYPDGALEWEFILPHIQFIFNNSVNTSTGQTPNEVCLGFRPREHVDLRPRGPKDIAAERSVKRKEAADSLAAAQVAMKLRYDSKHTPWRPSTGDLVFLRLKNYNVPGMRNRKLTPPRVGPFRVKRLTDSRLAAELDDLPATWKIHPVVSLTELEPHPHTDDPYKRATRRPAKLRVDDELLPPEFLLDRRQRKVGRGTLVTEYRVRFERTGPEHDDWVRQEHLPPGMVKKFDRHHS